MQGAQNIAEIFSVALKMIYVIDKKQMYDSVITGKEYASKDCICVISMCLTSFNVYVVWMCMFCMCMPQNCYLGFSSVFGTRSGFFGEDRLATLLCSLA